MKKINKKRYIAKCILIGITVISGTVGVGLYSCNGDIFYDLSGSTGIYAEKYDNTISDADYWIVDCKALTEGVLKKSIRNKKYEKLIVEGRTTDGEMILAIAAGTDKKEYDISNTNGELEIDIGELETDLLKLSVSHPQSENIFVCIKWM